METGSPSVSSPPATDAAHSRQKSRGSSTSSKPRHSGKKAVSACNRCRNRKIRCSGTIPCTSCLKVGVQCYEALTTKEYSRGYVLEMERRMQWLEDLVAQHAPGIDLQHSGPPMVPSVSAQLHLTPPSPEAQSHSEPPSMVLAPTPLRGEPLAVWTQQQHLQHDRYPMTPVSDPGGASVDLPTSIRVAAVEEDQTAWTAKEDPNVPWESLAGSSYMTSLQRAGDQSLYKPSNPTLPPTTEVALSVQPILGSPVQSIESGSPQSYPMVTTAIRLDSIPARFLGRPALQTAYYPLSGVTSSPRDVFSSPPSMSYLSSVAEIGDMQQASNIGRVSIDPDALVHKIQTCLSLVSAIKARESTDETIFVNGLQRQLEEIRDFLSPPQPGDGGYLSEEDDYYSPTAAQASAFP